MQPHPILQDRLTAALPLGVKTRVYHVSTTPVASSAIFSAPEGRDEEKTFCESHFLGIASPKDDTRGGEIFVFAIEVLIFTTSHLTTVFVSKADSSGFASTLDIPKRSPSLVSTVSTVFLDFLIRPRLDGGPRLVLSLFARSQNQYLFPGSIDNKEKHVLDDRQLIKWWCRVLDSVWRPYDTKISDNTGALHDTIAAHLIVPGCDAAETRAFFPASSRQDSPSRVKWSPTYPLDLMVVDHSLPVRCLIPRLPDDPKARFLDDLDSDYIAPDGQWRSIRTLDQFWEMMSYRQECSAGRLVGFLWVVFSRSGDERGDSGEITNENQERQRDLVLPTPAQSQVGPSTAEPETQPQDSMRSISIPGSPPPSSPVIGPNSDLEGQSDMPIHALLEPHGRLYYDKAETAAVRWPDSTKGQAVIDAEQYQSMIDYILELDFEGRPTATASTTSWIDAVAKLNKGTAFGVDVTGSLVAPIGTAETRSEVAQQVNMLTAVRKKRKPGESGGSAPIGGNGEPTMLSSNAVRKKPKVDTGSSQ